MSKIDLLITLKLKELQMSKRGFEKEIPSENLVSPISSIFDITYPFHHSLMEYFLHNFDGILHQLMGVFCDRLKLCSTATLDRWTGQNKGKYQEKELPLLLVGLYHLYQGSTRFHKNYVGRK